MRRGDAKAPARTAGPTRMGRPMKERRRGGRRERGRSADRYRREESNRGSDEPLRPRLGCSRAPGVDGRRSASGSLSSAPRRAPSIPPRLRRRLGCAARRQAGRAWGRTRRPGPGRLQGGEAPLYAINQYIYIYIYIYVFCSSSNTYIYIYISARAGSQAGRGGTYIPEYTYIYTCI
jgi:hypothetical protein